VPRDINAWQQLDVSGKQGLLDLPSHLQFSVQHSTLKSFLCQDEIRSEQLRQAGNSLDEVQCVRPGQTGWHIEVQRFHRLG